MEIPKAGEVRKPSKTLAGVTPVAVMCKPRGCKHGVCLYCPSLNVPQSYTPKSPPVLRAVRLKYDSYEQILSRLRAFKLMNHPVDKIELIIMGGNFLEYPPKYQYEFVKKCYDALNGKVSKSLEEAKKRNMKAKHRCVALCIETRPDSINAKNIEKMLDWGATRVELGVQALDDEIYKKVNRGHDVKAVVKSSKHLRDAGFKIGYHMMLGLPGSDKKKDLQMFKMLFNDERFKPDQLKIYPCQVIKGAELEELHKKGKYMPYSQKDVQNLIIKIMKLIPNYCRVMRVMREIPPDYLTEGILRIDLRKDIELALRVEGVEIKEIRFREIGFAIRDLKKGESIDNKLELKISKYKCSGGKEYFLEFVNKDNILFGLCRLRVIEERNKMIGDGESDDGKNAFLRELHVYGQSLKVGEKGKDFGQHKGLGKKLMAKAEEICKSEGVEELKVISGVGVREYYKKLGYKLNKEGYMVKKF
ncbi:tRNA uridine(34) 5-carboxymethylaminomethyl modification radical SAM/GNAT enzyme Elp3 [archaeon]|jgi:elongator complex protein 3|nr:tRNA uridine(34) 5-carboxymethylaminomethyl modification radical SAM/GNAT enzyme Elp3 [archaeon]MBT4241986.1 tRNA uridine(34) 5-carboxymethylaminomethyl modification radical SAM/GNAT enzyme Elp3 [archaeon]MBT4418533.1 tRNA uridine(34) 5-carboxymethylaminomethyl modification radical SAM/GNAT enzyme Elp3 [archaeon]